MQVMLIGGAVLWFTYSIYMFVRQEVRSTHISGQNRQEAAPPTERLVVHEGV